MAWLILAGVFPGLHGVEAATRVTITPEAQLRVNGHPFLPIALNPGPPTDLTNPEGADGWTELAQGGVTLVRAGAPAGQDWNEVNEKQLTRYLDVIHAHGIYAAPMLRELVDLRKQGRAEKLAAFVSRFKNHPAVLFWKSADEPQWGKIPVEPLKQAYDLIHQLDTDHPVWLAQAPKGTIEQLKPYSAACDILGFDIYPISEPPGKHAGVANKGLSLVGDFTLRAAEISDRPMPIYMILQGCWSGVLPQHNPKNRLMFPTFREERYMLYEALIDGADSIAFFGLTFGLNGRDSELGFNWTWWRAVLRPLLAQIKAGTELYPVLTSPPSKYPLEYTGKPQIEAMWKEAGVYLYIFAAAREGKPLDVTFSGLQDGTVEVLFENRTLSASGGKFQDRFAEHDVHVYRALRRDVTVTGKAP
jgi:hypothetical protein